MIDATTIDSVIDALYASVSGRAGEPRNWDVDRALFLPGAKLIRTWIEGDGTPAFKAMTVEEYIEDTGGYFKENDFHEAEIGRRVDRFGNMAHAWSAYEARHLPDDPEPFKRGINSIQLYFDGSRWWIVNMIWDNERQGVPLPEVAAT